MQQCAAVSIKPFQISKSQWDLFHCRIYLTCRKTLEGLLPAVFFLLPATLTGREREGEITSSGLLHSLFLSIWTETLSLLKPPKI